MSSDLPFNCEYAKSGRASCKKCRSLIAKDSLRLAVMVQSPVFDGKMPLWHHVDCFFKTKNTIKSTDDIANFHNIRWEDQELIQKKMGTSSKAGSSGNADFSVDIAKSNRSSCQGCGEKIDKGILRVAKIELEPGARYGPRPFWHHLGCFIQNINELGFSGSAASITGYEELSEENQDILSEQIPSPKVSRKRKAKEEAAGSKKTSEDKLFKAQNKMLFDMRDNLSKELTKKQMTELLEINDQHVPHGESRILDHLADCLVFGAIKECPDCKNAKPRFLNNVYSCPGYLTEWSKCQYETKFPERQEFNVPTEFQESFEFLKDYKCTVRERLFLEASEPSSKKNLPLSGHTVSVVGSKTFIAVNKKMVEELGGTYVSKLSAEVSFVIGVESDINKPKKMDKAKSFDIHVVSSKFFESIKKGSPVGYSVKEHVICPWGGDPILKLGIKQENAEKKKSDDDSYKSKSAPKKLKVSVTGGAAVDPESGLEGSCSVYQNGDNIYNAVLALVDTIKGTNSFYKIQLLKNDRSSSKWHVFRQWGRVGTTIGGTKVNNFNSLEQAIAEFEDLYQEKTGNEWWGRKKFVKKPGLMYPVEIDYGEEDVQSELKPCEESKLHTAVQELICLIFDVEAMKKAMIEFEIDLNKMPLGKLSKKQIESAYKVLTEAQEILTTSYNSAQIMDVSNRFFTLIPHDFGMKKPPLLDDLELIKSKVDMLDSLLEIAFAYTMLKKEHTQKDPVTFNYEKLNTDISVLEKGSNEYEMLENYLKDTHAPTHTQYTLRIDEIFKVNRQGEDDRYSKFKELHNKKLLWHGSRLTNFVGILSQGLRIAPPEAPCTGYMFGKGVYFADMVSKSANYCFTSHHNRTGLLLLCEVALGNMLEKTDAEFITELPEGMHSTKGMGAMMPNPKGTIVKDGVEIPSGKPLKSEIKNSRLLYNEYIVYDVNQIKIKYLLKVDFNYHDY